MSVENRIARAAEQCDEDGYYRDDGRFVDPLPVQKVAIEEGFRQAAEENTFDIWSVVTWRTVAKEGDTLAENFERVVEAFDDAVDKPELRQRMQELAKEAEQSDN